MFINKYEKNLVGILYLLSSFFFLYYLSYILHRESHDCFHHFIENSLKSPSAFPSSPYKYSHEKVRSRAPEGAWKRRQGQCKLTKTISTVILGRKEL